MQFVKKSVLGVCVSLLFSVVLLFGLVFGLFKLFGSPGPIKHALKDSNIYQTVVGNALSQAQKEKQGGGEKIPLDRPEVQNIVKTAASPKLLQTQAEQTLDAVYAWMQGKTQKLEFVIELGDIKNNVGAGVEQYVAQRVSSLPACSRGDSGNIQDPFNATCRPQGADINQIAAQAKAQIVDGEFLKETRVDASSLKGKDDKTVEQSLSAVPATYKAVKWSVYGLALLALVLAAGVVFLSLHWRAGLKKVGVIFVIIGAMSIFFSWLAGLGMQRVAELATEPLQKSGFEVARILARDLRSWWIIYGLILLIIGLGILIILRLTRKKLEKQIAREVTTTGDTPQQPTTEPPNPVATKTKPQLSRKLVQ